jgi:hypothetical protein
MLVYMAAIMILAATSISLLLLSDTIFAAAPDRFEAVVEVIRFINRLLIWNPLISTLLPGLLMQHQPRRN